MIAVGELVLDLYPALAAAYLLDCVVRIGDAGLLLSSRLGRSALRRGPRFFFAGFLPSDRAYALAPETLARVSQGIFVLRRDDGPVSRYRRDSYDFVAYEETIWTLDGARLRAAGEVIATFPSARRAEAFATEKRELAGLHPAARKARLTALRRTARDRLAQTRTHLQPLLRATQVASFALSITLFALLPALALAGPGAEATVRTAAGAAGVLYVTVLALAFSSVRAMRHRGIEPPHAALLAMVLFPLAAAHASYQVTRSLAADVDALTAAAALLPRDDFAALARTELHGIALAAATKGDAAWLELWQERISLLDSLLCETGLTRRDLRMPAAARDGAARGWCPFCAATYVDAAARCEQCDVPLIATATAAASQAP